MKRNSEFASHVALMVNYLREFTSAGSYGSRNFISFFQVQEIFATCAPECYRTGKPHYRKMLFSVSMRKLKWIPWNRIGRDTTAFMRPERERMLTASKEVSYGTQDTA